MKKQALDLDINVGDTLLTGRFKNRKEVVKTLGTDEKGQPTYNGKKLLSVRIAKAMEKKANLDKLVPVVKKVVTKQAGALNPFDWANLRQTMSALKQTRKLIPQRKRTIDDYHYMGLGLDRKIKELAGSRDLGNADRIKQMLKMRQYATDSAARVGKDLDHLQNITITDNIKNLANAKKLVGRS